VRYLYQSKLIRLVKEFENDIGFGKNELHCFVCNGIPTLGREITDERIEDMGHYFYDKSKELDATSPGNQMRYLDMAQQGLFL
jgi:hypothetical protein